MGNNGLSEDIVRQQLQSLLLKVRENEEKLLKFGRLEQQLMAARTLVQLLWVILQDFPGSFLIDSVRLVLRDPDGEWARALGADSVRTFSGIGLSLRDDLAQCERMYGRELHPVLAPYRKERHGDLFASLAETPGSVALLPLVRQHRLVGSLHLASSSRTRFAISDGTYFLERLAAFMVMCLENALYYEKLERSSWLDGLTQVNNRRYFDVRIREAVSHARRRGVPLSLLILDLDYFKRVNDQWGHQAGDSVLQQAAQVMRSLLRASDSFARYGGEEFVALLPDTDCESASEIGGRILRAIAGFAFHVGPTAPVDMTVSIGVAQLDGAAPAISDEDAGNRLVAQADAALYRAKEQGRNCVVAAA